MASRALTFLFTTIYFCATLAFPDITLSTDILRVVVSSDASGTCVSSLAFTLKLAGEPANSWTPNLVVAGCGANASTTAMQIGGSDQPIAAFGGTVTGSTSSSVHITGISMGNNIATEDWDISLVGAAFTWTVRRTFLSSGTAESDQMPALALMTSGGAYDNSATPLDSSRRGNTAFPDWRESVQMPSFSSVDDALIDNATGGGYPVRGGTGLAILGDATHGGARRLLLSPAGVAMLVNHSDCRFAVTRPVAIFVTALAVGAECAAGPAGSAGYTFTTGDVKTMTLVTEFLPTKQGHGLFDLQLPPGSPAAFVAEQAAIAVKIFQLPSGYINGNSPACESCLHEMGIFPQLEMILRLESPAVEPSAAGIVVPPPSSVHVGTAHFFDYVLTASVNTSGVVAPRWSLDGGNDWSFGGIMDQYPNFILAAYYHAVKTGDRAAVSRWMPTLSRIVDYMLKSMGVGESSLLTNTFPDCNGTWGPPLGKGSPLADNWFDDVRFGWHDALVGMYAVQSFQKLGDLHLWLGDPVAANVSYAVYEKMVAAYNERYWDAGAGIYHDWVDINNIPRTYFYTWHQFLAIEFGIASPAQAASIMAHADAETARVQKEYNITTPFWCVPCNFHTLNHSDLTCAFDGEDTYGHYENGACFYAHTGFQTLALSRTRGAEAAFDRLTGALKNFEKTRFWSQRFSWLDNMPMGADIATENLFVVWGGLFASMGVRIELLKGVVVVGPAAVAFEGANFTIGVGGKDLTINIKGGWAHVLN